MQQIKQFSQLLSAQSYFLSVNSSSKTKLDREIALKQLKLFLRATNIRNKKLFSKESDNVLWEIISTLSATYTKEAFAIPLQELDKESNLTKMNDAYEYVEHHLRSAGIIQRHSLKLVSAILSAVVGNTPIIDRQLLQWLNFTTFRQLSFKDILRKIAVEYRDNFDKYNTIASKLLYYFIKHKVLPIPVYIPYPYSQYLEDLLKLYVISPLGGKILQKLEEYIDR